MLLNHTGTQTIETQRLILRRFEIADTHSVFQTWINDPEVHNNYGEKACNIVGIISHLTVLNIYKVNHITIFVR